MAGRLSLLTISLAVAVGAYFRPAILDQITAALHQHGVQLPFPISQPGPPPQPPSPPPTDTPTSCPPHAYTTQLISLDPLLIYITNFTTPAERTSLIATGLPLLEPSPIIGAPHLAQARTSWSAPLPDDDATVTCILSRAAAFLGPSLLTLGRDEMGSAQMVRYTAGQKFDVHTDWFARPRLLDEDGAAGRRRLYNRVATIFAVLEADGVEGGETWFPHVQAGEGEGWRALEGGTAFRAVPGNALFWVNLLASGTGDARTAHAGLPVEGGFKTALNIWPRVFFGPDA
ncbi:hypothetical protein B0T25DRAFT_508513 [Lasiosphaeria hispida]|uniref:Prolyl 4-hydroxylase alpha subunit domain-containing protein n=1 Tax=Lasiosphaeria hispida TaxID=260671 RepID=A0AAJ0H871_9PEZI|nr:hypothetical protein B0T25DRAFT_508513 [Lasiosphaeria hispida]